jgi:hypothetical protein
MRVVVPVITVRIKLRLPTVARKLALPVLVESDARRANLDPVKLAVQC